MNRRTFLKKTFKSLVGVSGAVVVTSAASELLKQLEVKTVDSFDLTTISIVHDNEFAPKRGVVERYAIKRSKERNVWYHPIEGGARKINI